MEFTRRQYDESFFDFIDTTALQSAAVVVPLLKSLLAIEDLVDFGCGRGAWLRVWQQSGISSVVGVDSELVDTARLLFEPSSFVAHDLSSPIDLSRRFSLVQSLEVAEHIEPALAETFIENLQRHGDAVLFSAALPGQCGIQHVNERPFGYWRKLFQQHGFVALDPLRPRLIAQAEVAWWYRYGLLLYVREPVFSCLPEPLQESLVAPGIRIPDYSPPSLKLRRLAMRWMPKAIKEWSVRAYMRSQQKRAGTQPEAADVSSW